MIGLDDYGEKIKGGFNFSVLAARVYGWQSSRLEQAFCRFCSLKKRIGRIATDAGGAKPTFLCSDAVLGLSGVVFMLAGVAATGEEEVFSIMSAGIFFFVANIQQMQRNYGPPVAKKNK